MHFRISAMLAASVFLFAVGGVSAQAAYPARYSPVLVSDPPANDQDLGSGLAVDPYANFVAAWTEQIDYGSQVFARQIAADGAPMSPAFSISDSAGGYSSGPSIASDAIGNFVVAWAYSGNGDLSHSTIYARRYNASAQAISNAVQVNAVGMEASSGPRIAMNAAGDYVVAWSRADAANSIVARVFDASGNALGNEFSLSFLGDNVMLEGLALNNGRKLIVEGVLADSGQVTLGLQCFNVQGDALSDETTIAATTATNYPDANFGSLSLAADGNILVSWAETRVDGGAFSTVQAASYGSDCMTPNWHIEALAYPSTDGNIGGTRIAVNDASGEVAVAWSVYDSDGYVTSVRRYDESGVAISSASELARSAIYVGVPQLALQEAGYTAVWNQTDPGTLYETYSDVYAQAFGALSPPTVTLNVNPVAIQIGQHATLSWTSTYADACIASGGWSGDKPTSGGTQLVNPDASGVLTYTLTCKNAAGSVSQSRTLTVSAPPPTAMLNLSATSVAAGTSVTLSWSSSNADACEASGAWNGSKPASGTETFKPMEAGTFAYKLTCTGDSGTADATQTLTVTATESGSTGLELDVTVLLLKLKVWLGIPLGRH